MLLRYTESWGAAQIGVNILSAEQCYINGKAHNFVKATEMNYVNVFGSMLFFADIQYSLLLTWDKMKDRTTLDQNYPCQLLVKISVYCCTETVSGLWQHDILENKGCIKGPKWLITGVISNIELNIPILHSVYRTFQVKTR